MYDSCSLRVIPLPGERYLIVVQQSKQDIIPACREAKLMFVCSIVFVCLMMADILSLVQDMEQKGDGLMYLHTFPLTNMRHLHSTFIIYYFSVYLFHG